MAHKPPTRFSRPVRSTLRWLVPDRDVEQPLESRGESRYLLCHAQRLHDSLTRLPEGRRGGQCLVVGSWGLEVPYLSGALGWRDVTCICAPNGDGRGRRQRCIRRHPNGAGAFEFTRIEFDIESGPWPFAEASFDLAVFWGCFEHLRNDPEFALFELNRVCQPDATVSLITDNAISLQATHGVIRGHPMPMRLHWPSPDGHWRLYAPNEIRDLLTGTGWRVDLLTSIVPDPPVYWKWWKRFLFKRLVADQRRGFGLAEAYWNAFILAHAVKAAPPTRSYPGWLYKDEKIRQLKIAMMEMLSDKGTPAAVSA